MNPQVQSFYDPATFTFTYVVYDRDGGRAAIVDPVLDYDPASARTSTASADRVLAFVREHGLVAKYDAAPEAVTGWGVGGSVRGRPARVRDHVASG